MEESKRHQWLRVTVCNELQYATSSNFKKGLVKKNISSGKTSATYTKLAKNKTYYVRVWCEWLLQVKVEQRKEDPHQKVVYRIKESIWKIEKERNRLKLPG